MKKNYANFDIVNRYKHRSWYMGVILFFLVCYGLVRLTEPKVISPCQKDGCFVKVVMAQETKTDMQSVIDQTIKEFSPEGASVVHDALNVMWCEHRFNIGDGTDKPHQNDNGTLDWGSFQINSLWDKVFGTKFHTDYKENIRVAHQVWLRSHSFNQWSCQSVYHVLGE